MVSGHNSVTAVHLWLGTVCVTSSCQQSVDKKIKVFLCHGATLPFILRVPSQDNTCLSDTQSFISA